MMHRTTGLFLLLFVVLIFCGVAAAAPERIEAVYLDGIGILACWKNVAGASGYQVSVSSEGSSDWFQFDVKSPTFHLQDALPNRTYAIQVRERTAKTAGKYSPKISVYSRTSGSENQSYSLANEVQFTMNVNKTAILSWPNTPNQLTTTTANGTKRTLLSCLSFSIEICRREKVFRRWTTNETLVSDVIVRNVFNDTTNTTSTLSYKNYTIHYVKEHAAFIHFRNVSCAITASNELRFRVDGLRVGTNYSYIVKLYFGTKLLGVYAKGNFTATPYIPPPAPVVVTIFTGVVVYGISCGVLIVALLVSFVFAWICKWERFISDVHIKKAKYKEEREEQKARLLRKKQRAPLQPPPSVRYKGKEALGPKVPVVL